MTTTLIQKSNRLIFYIYLHLDPVTDEVRYVGKGHGRRTYSFSHRKGHHKNWIAKLAKGKKRPPMIGAKIAKARKGMKFTEEHKANLRKARALYFAQKKVNNGNTP